MYATMERKTLSKNGVKTNIIGLMVADLVPQSMCGTAYGFYNALLGILDLPASLIAGILWQGRKILI
jgi:hypothetical protein